MKVRLILFFVLWSPTTSWADGMRCGQRLISEGDTKYKLESLCGQPVAREIFEDVRRFRWKGRHGQIFWSEYPVMVQQWTYDLGKTRFLRIVTLEKGIITRIETADRP